MDKGDAICSMGVISTPVSMYTVRSPGLLFVNIFPKNTLDDDIESTKEDSLRHSLSDEVGINFDT
jgi:hypothetical protein